MAQTLESIPTKPQPAQGEWTYEDYLNLPDDGRRYEIIEGVLYVTNAPDYDHQFTVMEIAFQLKLFTTPNKLGVVLTAPFEVHLSEKTRPVQPDVLFIRTDQQPAPGAKFFEGVPDLVVEVLSPSTTRTDQSIKFSAYEQAGVSEYWIANPKTRSVEVFTLSAGEYALVNEFIGDEVIESVVLTGLTITTHTLFNPGGWERQALTPIILDGASLTIEQVITVAYGQPGAPSVELSIKAKAKVPFWRIL